MTASRPILGLIGLLLLCLLSARSGAEPVAPPKKIALIIANSTYQSAEWPALKNPVNDARLLRETLAGVGFEVQVPAINLSREALQKRLADFAALSSALPENSIALIYYSGHGIQVDGVNYVVPVNGASFLEVENAAGPGREKILSQKYVSLNHLLDSFGLARRSLGGTANILILDACRLNPLDGRTRSGSRPKGLADVPNTANSLIAFAASPGTAALDGDGGNSPYAIALSRELKQPKVPVELLFNRVTSSTLALTDGLQRPDYRVGLSGFFCFDGCDATAATAPLPQLAAAALPGREKGPAATATAFAPPQTVRVSGLTVGRYPVTQAQYRLCVEEAGCSAPEEALAEPNQPMVGVSWAGAADYAAWLSQRTGETWELPTADEWQAVFAPLAKGPRTANRRLPRIDAAAEPADQPAYVGKILEWTASCAGASAVCGVRTAMGAAYDGVGEDLMTRHEFPAEGTGKKLGFRLLRK